MQEFETVILNNNITYKIINEKNINNISYVLLANVNDDTDICFRKVIKKDDGEYFVGLDDEAELQNIIIHFAKDIANENK